MIALKRPNDYQPKNGAIFQIHFEKARGFAGDDAKSFEAQLITNTTGIQQWITRPLNNDGSYEQVIKLTNQGCDQNKISEQLNIHKSNVSRHLKRARQEGKIVS